MNKGKRIPQITKQLEIKSNFNFNRSIGTQTISITKGYNVLSLDKRSIKFKKSSGKENQQDQKTTAFKIKNKAYVKLFDSTKLVKTLQSLLKSML